MDVTGTESEHGYLSQVKNQEILGVLPIQLELNWVHGAADAIEPEGIPMKGQRFAQQFTFESACFIALNTLVHSTYKHACFAMNIKIFSEVARPDVIHMAWPAMYKACHQTGASTPAESRLSHA